MNCDEAFDRMTVTGAATDEPLQRHLSNCRRCRAMQDTLSPAMDWLSSATAQPEMGAGAGERPTVFLTEEAVQVAERAARQLSPVAPSLRGRIRLRNRVARWVALTGMAVLGLFAVITPSSNKPADTSSANLAVPSQLTACLWTKRDAERHARPTADQVIASCMACHITLR